MRIKEVKNEICKMANILLDEGITTDANGCLSARVANKMVITPGKILLSRLTPNDLSIVDIASCTPEEGPKPDRRFALHAAIYKKRKKFNSMIHVDSLSILTSSKKGIEVPPLLDDMAQLVGVSAKVAITWPYRGATPVLSALKKRNAVLLKNSGGLCGAGSFDDAHAVAQVLEKGCKAFIESTFMGGGFRINKVEALLMRIVYQIKYSKQNEKNTI